ncbi:MAG: hypothetical protein KBS60_04250 [Phascolarctobacterium sp.]|nr:hypothetical protein [Candidatus Phascolarctobacterium caballi]
MIETSALYKELFEQGGRFETHIQIEIANGQYINFWDASIFSVNTVRDVFTSHNASVGNCVSSRISFQAIYPETRIPEMAKVRLSVRVRLGDRVSEEIPQGTFFIDTRKKEYVSGVQRLTVTGFDAMMLAESDMDYNSISFPATTWAVVSNIATKLGVTVEEQTRQELVKLPYTISKPKDKYSQREILGFIATMCLGNFVITKDNKLKLVKTFGDPSTEPSVLIDENGAIITIGGDSILV